MSVHSWRKVVLTIIFVILSIFYGVLFYQHASFNSEMMFNVAHIKSLTNIFTSPINFDYWNHTGSQINLFSPWLTLLSGLPFLNLNVATGFTIYLTVITFLTFVSSYYYINRFSNDIFESLLFSVIYTLSFNRFFLVFQQQSLANYLAVIFLPMVYYGLYVILHGQYRQWYILAWGMSLIVWTAPYLAIAVTLTMIPLVILTIFSKTSHSWSYWGKSLLALLQATCLTVLVTLGFTAPLIEQQLQTKWRQVPIVNFDFVKWFKDFHLSKMQLYALIAIAVLLGLLLILIFFQSHFAYKLILLEMIPIVILVIGRYDPFEFDISRLIFSFQSVLDFFLAMIVSRVVILIFQEAPAIWKLVLVLAVTAACSGMIFQQATSLQPQTAVSENLQFDAKKVVRDFHDKVTKNGNQFLINERKAKVNFYTQKSDYWIQYYNPQATTMDLPIQNYAGYRITLNNEKVKIKTSPRQTIQLQTNPGKNIIEIHAQYTWIGILALLINLFSFMLLGYLSINKGFWTNKKNAHTS